ncbi:MAG TPA: TIGR03936 family radical SAM-associated protein [Jiangellaceae bacterium]
MAERPPHEQRPPVQRLRVRFARRGRLRFTSHRDFQRAFERGLRRAGVPVAYSQGFTPHPKVSYAGAAPTGAASEAEYLELSVTDRCDVDEVAAALDAALPPGLDIVSVTEAGQAALADQLQVSSWIVRLADVPPADVEKAVEAFLAESSVVVERMTGKGRRELDVRDAVVRADVESGEPVVRLVLNHVTPTVRPTDVVRGIRLVSELPDGAEQVTRLEQGVWDDASATVVPPDHQHVSRKRSGEQTARESSEFLT